MKLCGSPRRGVWLMLALCCLVTATAWADDVPDTQSMIQSLKPLKTRSLRNLFAKPASTQQAGRPAATVDDQPPSLSLAIQFDYNSARVSNSSQLALSRLANALRSADLHDYHFMIEGHTDARGQPDYNYHLSQLRAEAVKRVLVSRGVSADLLETVGKGADDPANAADPYAAANRRVRVVNLDAAAN